MNECICKFTVTVQWEEFALLSGMTQNYVAAQEVI